MAKLKQAKLSDLCFLVTDGTHDSPKLLKKGYPLIKGKDINQGYINFENCDYISLQDHLKVISRSKPEYSDILFANIGNSIGDLAYVNTTREFSIKNVALIKPDKSKIDNLYLYYYMLSPIFQDKIKSIKQGAAQPFISLNLLRNFEITIINNIAIQNKIAKILSNYDDLIENNNRRIKILEEIAQKIYKEWFVDFKFPGHENTTIKESVLSSIITPIKGKNITKSKAKIGNVPVVGGGIEPAYYHNVANTQAPVITISASGANAGFVNLYYKDIWASDCSYIDATMTNYIYYIYLLLKNNQIEITNMQLGAAQPHVYPRDLVDLKIKEFPIEVVANFEKMISPIFENIKVLSNKNENLKQTRDILLPRLISGEINVENMEVL